MFWTSSWVAAEAKTWLEVAAERPPSTREPPIRSSRAAVAVPASALTRWRMVATAGATVPMRVRAVPRRPAVEVVAVALAVQAGRHLPIPAWLVEAETVASAVLADWAQLEV